MSKRKINTPEAQKIIGDIIQWNFVLMGVKERDELKIQTNLESYSLLDLIKANQMVKNSNKRRQNRQDTNKIKKGIFLHMTCDERLIAGVYATLHYQPQRNCHILVNDKMMGIVQAKY